MRKYDSRKLDESFVSYEDMFIGEKVVNRSELCENLGITNKKLRSIGGYTYFLNKYGLERPSPYYYKNKRKMKEMEMYINKFISENDRIPILKEVVENTNICYDFLTNIKLGYKDFLGKIGIEWYKNQTQYRFFDTDNKLIVDKFLEYYEDYIPTVTELIDDYNDTDLEVSYYHIKNRFGDYTNFLQECGYNEFKFSAFSNRSKANDGHMCDSKSEILVDNYLSENGIEHSVHIPYKELIDNFDRRFISDFLLEDNTVVEYFGLVGIEHYDKKVKRKVNILENNNINYIAIYPDDLDNLDEVFKDYTGGDC